MKNKSWLVSLFIGFCLIGGLVSCTDEEEVRPKTVADVIINEPRFSIFESILKQAGMSDALKSGRFTIFAPNDEAFKKMSINDPTQVNTLSVDSLRAICQYLILDGIFKAEDFKVGENVAVKSLGGGNLFISKSSGSFKVNMANVVTSDLLTDNGVVHELDHVPSSANESIIEWIGNNPSFSFFSAAATKAAAANPTLIMQMMSDASKFTVFVPDNQAFINAGFPTIQSVTDLDSHVLLSVVGNHILEGAQFTTDFRTGNVGSIVGSPILISVGSTISVSGNNNVGTLPKITRSDIMMRNGVVHVIDGVIIP